MAVTNVTTRSSRPDRPADPVPGGSGPVWEAPTGARAVAAAGRAVSSSVLIASGRALTRVLLPRGAARLRAAIAAETGPVKVSFGAGTVDLPGWLDTDCTWRAELGLDVTRPWPVPTESVDYVYADQVIEHFPLDVGRAVLHHTFAALAPGGSIRLATPDVERTARLYLERGARCATHLDRHRARGYAAEHAVDVLRVTFSENGHRFCHDFESLASELRRAGYVDVRRCEAGESDDPVLRGLESRVDPTEVATTLAVEARKPTRPVGEPGS